MVVVAGEITTKAKIDYSQVVRNTVRRIGYTSSEMGFDADTCAVMIAIDRQSPDISQGVTEGEGLHKEQGAGDQGLMFGLACDETPELMPLPIMLAHQLVEHLAAERRSGKYPFLRPDSKSQVTVQYRDGKPVRVDAVVISTQHSEDVALRDAERHGGLAGDQEGRAGSSISTNKPCSTSIRPAASSPAARSATAA